jgi:MFS family permease
VRRLGNIYHGWWVLAAATVIHGTTGGVSFWAFGLYIQPLESDFDWSRSEVSLGFSASMLASGACAPFLGRWVDRYGPRRFVLVGALAFGLTFFLLALTDNLWQWYLLHVLNGIARTPVHIIPLAALMARWFQRRRGVAMGVLASGFMIGGFTVVPVMRVVIDWIDWDGAFVFSGFLVLLLYTPLAIWVVRDQPRDSREAAADGLVGRATRASVLTGVTVGRAMRTPLFWLITLAVTTMYFGIMGWIVHTIPFFESVGISPGWAVAIVSVGAAGGVVTRLLFGLAVDRVGSIGLTAAVLTGFLIGALLALYVGGGAAAAVVVFTIFWAIGTGGGPMLDPLLLAPAFGQAHFAAILGVVTAFWTVGLVASPAIVAAIFDATGSYDWALVVLMLAMAVALMSFGMIGRARRPAF